MSKNARSEAGISLSEEEGPSVDVVIAGAGPAGAIAARHLAQAGRSVLIVDRLRAQPPRLGETLPGAAQRLLARHGLATLAVSGEHHAPVGGGLTVWGSDAAVPSDALQDPYGPGLRLDRRHFDSALRAASLEAGCRCWTADVKRLTWQDGVWRINLDDGRHIRAGFIMDATGRRARLARLLGIGQRRKSDLVALYQLAKPAKNAELTRTLIEATPEGWIYAGRLADGRWSIGYHTLAREAVRLRRSPEAWLARLAGAPHLASRLGALSWEGGQVSARDAGGMILDTPYGEGWIAVGDAVLAFDPIAGQGLFNALRTGIAAAEAILTSRYSAYAEEVARVAAIYTGRRLSLYQAESRWADRAFWQTQQHVS